MKSEQLDKTDGQLLNLLELVESVEFESKQLEVFEGLKAGNAVLKKIHESMSADDVAKLMDDTAEAQAAVDVSYIYYLYNIYTYIYIYIYDWIYIYTIGNNKLKGALLLLRNALSPPLLCFSTCTK
jgi:hypothetical protein